MKKLYFLLLSVLLAAGVASARTVYVDITGTDWWTPGNMPEKVYVHIGYNGNYGGENSFNVRWEATPIAEGSTIYKITGEYGDFNRMRITKTSDRDAGEWGVDKFGDFINDGSDNYNLIDGGTYVLVKGENGTRSNRSIYVDIRNTDWGTPEKVYNYVSWNDTDFHKTEGTPVQPGSTIYRFNILYGNTKHMYFSKNDSKGNVEDGVTYGDFKLENNNKDAREWGVYSQTLYTLTATNGATLTHDYCYQGTSCFINYEKGWNGESVTWSHDQAMTKGEGNVWNYSVSTAWESGIQAGVRVYVDEQPAVWYQTMKVNDGDDDRYLGGHTDSETMVAEGTTGATNMHLCGPAHWDLTFDADTKVITGTRTYTGYDVRFAHKDNDYNFYHDGYDPIAPSAEGEVTTDEITNLGKDFLMKVWHGDLNVQGMVHGATIAEADTWVGANVRHQDKDNEGVDGLAKIAVTNQALHNFVKVVYNVATKQVKVIKTENNKATAATISVNVADKGWENVTARFYEKEAATDGEAYVDVELEAYTAPASVMAREGAAATPTHTAATTLGFDPAAVAFYQTGDESTITGRSAYDAQSTETTYGVDAAGVVTGLSSIIASENVAPVYYNMQGVRVDQPTTGMYIVVRNGVATKQYIR